MPDGSPETDVELVGFAPGVDIAERAGLQKGDVLISANGQPVRSVSRLRDVIDDSKGSPLTLAYSRKGQSAPGHGNPGSQRSGRREALDDRRLHGVAIWKSSSCRSGKP